MLYKGYYIEPDPTGATRIYARHNGRWYWIDTAPTEADARRIIDSYQED